MFLEERMKVGYGHQSQQWKDFIQVEAYYHLVSLSRLPQFLPTQYCLVQQPSGLRCANRDGEEGIERYMNLGGGTKPPFNINIFLPNNTHRNKCPYTIGTGSRNQGTPIRVPSTPQKTRYSATADLLTSFCA